MTPQANTGLLFRQLFDRKSCTFTYLLADRKSSLAVLIDPVDSQVDRDLRLISEHQLNLAFALNTHVHADHLSATGLIKRRIPNVRSVIGAASKATADLRVHHGDVIPIGSQYKLSVIATPGHTQGCVSYHLPSPYMHPGLIFTGDTLFIRGCGRTDFQDGDSEALFTSVRDRLFALPLDTIVYPAHDYRGMTTSTIHEERHFNPRLAIGKTLDEFKHIMANLNLAYPQMMHVAVPANLNCGIPPLEP